MRMHRPDRFATYQLAVALPTTHRARERRLRLIAASISAPALGLASAALIGWALDAWAVTAVFGAIILAAVAVAIALGTGRDSPVVATTDWAVVRTALASRSEAVAVTDAEGGLVAASEAYAAAVGGYVSPLGLECADDENQLVTLAEEAWQSGDSEKEVALGRHGAIGRFELKLRRAGGDALIWSLRRADGERVRAEALRMIGGRAGKWFGQAGVMTVVTNGDGRMLAANRAFRDLALGSADASLDDALLTNVLAIDADGAVRLLNAPDRPIRLIELTLGAGPDDPEEAAQGDGDQTYLFLLIEGVSSVLPLGEAPASVPALLSTLPLGLALADRDGRFRFMNDAFQRAAGLTDKSGVLYPSDLVIEDDKAMVADAVRRIAAGQQVPRDLRIHLKEAPEEPVALTVARALGLQPAAVVLFLKDNSEQLKLERQVAQATKMQAVGQLAGGVAHDFNNILTAVIGYCDLMLMRHTAGDSDFDDITQIKQNANRAANLVRHLLAFSRQQTMRPQILQVSDVVGELSHLLKRLLGETITFNVKHGRNLGVVRADPGQLEQVIVNLAVNARDAMPDGGSLVISTASLSHLEVRRRAPDIVTPGDYVLLSVTDTGTGIAPEVIGKIFEPFFTTKEIGKGTGLGLSTVYGIVKQTGGFIFAESQPAGGTRFDIYLPVYHAEAPAVEAPVVKPPSTDLWGEETVLLVEDEVMVRAVAERALTRKGYRVLTASNGEEALDILDTSGEEIDLLISDVVMPTMDGPTLVGHARKRFPSLRIVFMSGYAEEQLRRSIDVPDVAFLPKPFSVQQLAEAARDALNKPVAT